MKTRILAALSAAAMLMAAAGWKHAPRSASPVTVVAAPRPAPVTVGKPRIEVVFALDTTGSMSGLINAAREKIWAIANTLALTDPAPDIKMGLLGFRDRGDAYITKLTPLTDDLDAVYTELMSFRAQGGGDGPESVNQALHEAVTRIKWSTDNKTYRVIYLVGDSPPHMDYPNDVQYPVSCKLAAEKAIVINSIQCGSQSQTTPVWQEIARRAEGSYFRVNQSGGAIVATTPFDKKLAELSVKMEKTRVFYGNAKVMAEQSGKLRKSLEIEKKASTAAKAQRAAFNASAAGGKNFYGRQELVNDVHSGRVKLDEIKKDCLPKPLQKFTKKQLSELVARNAGARTDLQKQIRDLAGKRQAWIVQELKKSNAKRPALDLKIYDSIKKQAAKNGIRYKSKLPSF